MIGQPVTDITLTNDEIRRYSRHLIMPEVGMAGQKKLKAARVLLVGAGGLGSPSALYLAAAGVGTLGIVDFDVVDDSNLQRQVLHGTSTVGKPKLASAMEQTLPTGPPGVNADEESGARSNSTGRAGKASRRAPDRSSPRKRPDSQPPP